VLLWLSLAPLIGGCIPFGTPYMLNLDSRDDVTPAVEQHIEVGKTTRTAVLLTLGEPDGRAADDSWFTYASVRASEVGAFLFLGFDLEGVEHESRRVARLTVRFNTDGIVSKLDFEQSQCSGAHDIRTALSAGHGCLDPRGRELSPVSATASSEHP
jgi:hypothetical protein